MINQQYTGTKGVYTTSLLLGKGGEGEVYELLGKPSEVLKIYTEPLSQLKAEKLQLMVDRFSEQMQTYAAWPVDLVRDKRGKPCGFVMKKLDDYVPLHMLFGPMDRKKIFPDKGYNFLVHVARNIATAFHTLHAAGLVVGDVNEGNLLVNKQGMVAFIDCDSFQLSDGNKFYYCEVGVPRYTPPELLRLSTFENVVRTTATDSFSMAILIFQMLFLGRHPFSGVNHTSEDIGEEVAIQRQLFAWSTRSRQQLLTPPRDSWDIKNLPDGIVDLFHQAFETGNRPLPALWIREISLLMKQMTTCSRSKLHSYPSGMSSCPWCDFKNRRNILYFIDDVYTAESTISTDFDKFIQGFRVEPVHIPDADLSIPPAALKPVSHPDKLKKFQSQKKAVALMLFLFTFLVFVLSTIGGFVLLGLASVVYLGLPWKWYMQTELGKLKEQHKALHRRIDNLLEEYRSQHDIDNYNHQGKRISQLITQYKDIPKNIQLKKRLEEERIYNQQLHSFLQQFALQDYAIPGIGASRKQSLNNAGITTASDISKLSNIKVQGIGSKYEQVLFSWQRQMASGFVYHPDNQQLNIAFLKILSDAEQSKKQLEIEIRTNYSGLQQLRQHLVTKRRQQQKQITDASVLAGQAHVELQAYRQLVKTV